ncbi:mediator complex, subunit Med7 [Gongronella butleri]|nr:mediator complex, subunit Med7 [Gongronella butleri]
MEQQTTGSAWPDPPVFYKRYKSENVAKLKQAQETGEFPSDLIKQPPLSDFDLKQLAPPEPPTDAYAVFDQQWQVRDRLPTLKEQNIKQLFADGEIDRVAELKRLNRTLIVQFLDLLDVLVKQPEEFGKRIENISTIFINMHHILNEYRPHQARETLRLLMEEQLDKKRQQSAEIRKKTKETMALLEQFASTLSAPAKTP